MAHVLLGYVQREAPNCIDVFGSFLFFLYKYQIIYLLQISCPSYITMKCADTISKTFQVE
jgi:hypothetical protein